MMDVENINGIKSVLGFGDLRAIDRNDRPKKGREREVCGTWYS